MEEMGLGFGAMALIAALVVYFGLLRPVESSAEYLDREVEHQLDKQTNRHDVWYESQAKQPENIKVVCTSLAEAREINRNYK